MKYTIALLCAVALAQTTYVPHGPVQDAYVLHEGQAYYARWQQVRAVCASHQTNDCESRALRVEVIVSRDGAVISRKHRVCETAGCKEEDPIAFVKAALRESAERRRSTVVW